MAQIKRPIGLTLDQPDYDRLVRFAQEHHWSLSQAARVIVLRCLDQYDDHDQDQEAAR